MKQQARRFAAALIAPLSLAVCDFLILIGGYLRVDDHWSKYFPGVFISDIVLGYVFFLLVGGVSYFARIALKLPLRAWIVVILFAAGAIGLAFVMATTSKGPFDDSVPWEEAGILSILLPSLTLPMSVIYCLIAGIPWRAPTSAPAPLDDGQAAA